MTNKKKNPETVEISKQMLMQLMDCWSVNIKSQRVHYEEVGSMVACPGGYTFHLKKEEVDEFIELTSIVYSYKEEQAN